MHLSLAERRRRFENGYVVICGIFAVLMVLTNIIGTKLFALFPGLLETGFGTISSNGPVILTTGIITYPLTFLFTDIASEVYGRRRANIMVTIGFVVSIMMLAIVNIAVAVTPADRYWADAAEQKVLGAEVYAVEKQAGSGLAINIEHRQFLSNPGAGEPVTIAVLRDGRPSFTTYHSLSESGGVHGQPYRSVSLQLPAGDVEAGDDVLPAIHLLSLIKEADAVSASISGGAHLPVQGVLLDDEGYHYFYTRRNNDERIDITGLQAPGAPRPGPVLDEAGLIPAAIDRGSRPLAIVNTMTPVDMQTAMTATFASPGILLMASMLAYLIAQYLDVFMYHFWKRITGSKKLWLRNNGSTWVSQLVDTITVNGIFLPVAFGMNFQQTLNVIICVYIVKMMLAALDTPLIYLGVWIEKKRLGYEWEDEVPDLLSDQSEALV